MLEAIKSLSIGLGVALLMVSCSKDMDDVNPTSTLSGISTDAAKVASTNTFLFSNLRSVDGKTWSFDVKREGDNKGANANSVMLALFGCNNEAIMLSAANVVSLSITGPSGTQDMERSFIESSSNACPMAGTPGYVNFTGFDANLKDGSIYTFTVTLNQAIQVTKADLGLRAGNQCITGTLEGPGCKLDLCGEGQGYFHKSEHWGEITKIMIGGQEYTVDEAVTLITSDKKEGGSDNKGGIPDAKAAFAQGVTVLLNRQLGWILPDAYSSQLTVIENYLSGLNVKLTLANVKELAGNAEAKEAAGYIGDHIDCDETESAE